ncbi:hypothetical protein FNF27_01900 [Cafeteria roenbergensis]|uniref:Uncharacterized protein n=1 Tax=Cafeteria roenbergensis TaxID=33653 RepID=A0A5A8DUL0_CAFRO|nr:hypothetical protein FNF28_03664 [Cafeteria roenbergensis]KAA0168958.1 hypothetical protein FNF31_00119 [Cafeteria roenbergensis]KAA0176619.1 hypothetical protein FNF27_01900 [Cafeteria roenbergensis]
MADGAGDKWSTPQELAATRAEVWLPGLGRLSPGYDVVPITDDVREFLRMDGIMLPPPPPGHVLKERDPRYESPEGAEGGLSLDEFPDSPGAESGADADASSEASSLKPPPPLAEFQVAISGVFEAHGPMLLPRLSWVTPWDGAWMNGEEAQCGSVGEVLTVLKASDAVTEAMGTEVDAPPPGGVLGPPNASLVLLDFDDVFARPERCFRAFVRGGHLLALSQLRATRFLPEAKALREVAVGAAESLIDAVSGRGIDIGAADAVFLNTFMVDFAVTPKGRPRLLDLHPLAPDSDLLLLEPSDLDDAQARCLAEDAATAEAAAGPDVPAFVPEVRLVESDKEATPELARRLELMPLPAELAVLMSQAAGASGGAAAAASGAQAGGAADSLEGAIRMAAAAAKAEK